MKPTAEIKKRRTNNQKWKGIYGVDRKYTKRVDRLADALAVPIRAVLLDSLVGPIYTTRIVRLELIG